MKVQTISLKNGTFEDAAKKLTDNESYIIMSDSVSKQLSNPIKGRTNLVLTNRKGLTEHLFSFDSAFRHFATQEEIKFWLYNQEIIFPKRKINVYKFEGDSVKI